MTITINERVLTEKELHKGNMFEVWNMSTGEYLGSDKRNDLQEKIKNWWYDRNELVFLKDGLITYQYKTV